MAEASGMPWDTIAKVGANLTAGIVGASGAKKARKELAKVTANAPKYKINGEAFQNQAMAKADAFGRDSAIQAQEAQIDQNTSNAIGVAKDTTSSTSSLLSTLAAINSNKEAAGRNLAMDEAQLRTQKRGVLMDVNNQMIDEKDKEWNYNVNMPYQMKVAALRDRQQYNQNLQLGAAGSA